MMLETWVALIILAFIAGGGFFGYLTSRVYDEYIRGLHEKINKERRAYRDLDSLARLQGHLLRDMGGQTFAPGSFRTGSANATEPKLKAVPPPPPSDYQSDNVGSA